MNEEELISQGFTLKKDTIAGEECVLVVGEGFDIKWTPDNLIYRSSMWTLNGKPINLSYRKFFNLTENIQLIPDPTSLKNSSIIEKIDGSTIIVSKFKGQLIIRTRGTFSAYSHNNGAELDMLQQKYPLVFNNDLINSEEYSIITEFVSPTNIIVLPYYEPDIFLTSIISHADYKYMPQNDVDKKAQEWNVPRPNRFSFNSVAEMVTQIKDWKGKEGVCCYFNKDQNIKKLKSLFYLSLHAFKSDMSLKNMLELYFGLGKPSTFNEFYNKVLEGFDFECAQMSIGFISKIIDAAKEVDKILTHMVGFVEPLKRVSRKDAALKINSSYGGTIRSGLAFTLLDSKPLNDKHLKAIMQQILS